MPLTNIGQQKTPGRPVEITFGADTGTPSDAQEVLLIGHAQAGATGTNTVIVIDNSGDLTAASGEVATKFGDGSELAKMVLAAVRANAGGSTYPQLKALPLVSSETSIPTAAQNAILATKAEYIVMPYDMQSATAERNILKTLATTMSGASRVSNNQFGSFGVGATHATTTPSSLSKFDSQYLIALWLRDTGTGANLRSYSLGEDAAAAAAKMAGNGVPFNPLDDVTISSVPAPLLRSDWITVGAGLESEGALNQGWTPIYTKPNGEMAFTRTVTTRLSPDGTGSPIVGAYYDVQDFNVLYYWRKTLYTRFSQPDFKQRKASSEVASLILSEALRLAVVFEDNAMFQAVGLLAKQFQVERNASDRHRFDLKTPVNVIPGLHVIATNVVATTLYDVITI